MRAAHYFPSEPLDNVVDEEADTLTPAERAELRHDADVELLLAEDAVAAALSLGGPNACEWATPSALARLRSALGPTPEPSVREVGPRGWVGGR